MIERKRRGEEQARKRKVDRRTEKLDKQKDRYISMQIDRYIHR